MKRIIAFLLAATLLLLAGCSRTGENTEEGFVDTETGIEYVYCTPMGLYPVNPETDEDEKPVEYLSVENRDGSKTVFYKVEYENPESFLCYKENGFYFLAYNKSISEPTVAEFSPIAASIYNSANTGRNRHQVDPNAIAVYLELQDTSAQGISVYCKNIFS